MKCVHFEITLILLFYAQDSEGEVNKHGPAQRQFTLYSERCEHFTYLESCKYPFVG